MYVDVSDWLLEDLSLDDVGSSGDIMPLDTTDGYYNYGVYYDYKDYRDYVPVYTEYYNYYNYYDYYDYYNYSNSISVNLQPISQSVEVNETVTFSVGATNTIDSCQWYVAKSATDAGTAIPGATSRTYSFIASASHDGNYYYCVVRRGGNSATSSRALLSVRDLTVYDIYVPLAQKYQMTFVVNAVPATTEIVSVNVSDVNVATATPKGLITGLSIGETDCTVVGSNGASAVFHITVVDDPLVAVLMNTAIAIRAYRGVTYSIYPNQMANILRGGYNSTAYNNLEELFTDIATAIREIDSTSDTINPQNFYNKILSLI